MKHEVSVLGGVVSRGRIASGRLIPTLYHTTTELQSTTGARGVPARRLHDLRCLRTSRTSSGEAPWNRPFKHGDLLCLVDRLRLGG